MESGLGCLSLAKGQVAKSRPKQWMLKQMKISDNSILFMRNCLYFAYTVSHEGFRRSFLCRNDRES